MLVGEAPSPGAVLDGRPALTGRPAAVILGCLREVATQDDLLQIPALTKLPDEAIWDLFWTRNLFPEKVRWSAPLARERAYGIVLVRVNVFLGRRVAEAFNVGGDPYFQWGRMHWGGAQAPHGGIVRYIVLPHPSGLNRLYNDGAVRLAVGTTLLQAIRSET